MIHTVEFKFTTKLLRRNKYVERQIFINGLPWLYDGYETVICRYEKIFWLEHANWGMFEFPTLKAALVGAAELWEKDLKRYTEKGR